MNLLKKLIEIKKRLNELFNTSEDDMLIYDLKFELESLIDVLIENEKHKQDDGK